MNQLEERINKRRVHFRGDESNYSADDVDTIEQG